MPEGRSVSAGFNRNQRAREQRALRTGLYSPRQARRIGSGTLTRDTRANERRARRG